ncbi:mitochondrial carrier domain-containing protein [Pilobolus umbonatus]|nr:mitochondrial carrier domain-containing protein [Pilobolus umbonatus]
MSTSTAHKLHESRFSAQSKITHTKSYVHFVAGGVGGFIAAVCTSPLDVVKTRLQSIIYQHTAEEGVKHSKGIINHIVETGALLVQIKRVEGSRGYFKGLGPNLVGIIPARSIHFYTYGNGKIFFTRLNNGKETAIVHLNSAATAGIVTSTLTNPIWGKQSVYKNSFDCAYSMMKKEEPKSLFRGMGASYLGVIEGTIQWVINEHLKLRWGDTATEIPKNNNVIGGKSIRDWAGSIAAAATAKLTAGCIAYPHEVVRTRLRQPALMDGTRKYKSLIQCFKLIIREEGLTSLFSGMTAHLMRVVPNAAIM